MRPRVVVYNEVSVDGRVVGFDLDPGRYYARGFRWQSDAIFMGSTTATAFGPAESPDDQARAAHSVDKVAIYPGFEELVTEPKPLLVVPDSGGKVRCWVHALAQPWYRGVLVLASRSTPPDYLRYLERRGIEYLVAGNDRVDLAQALAELARSHQVTSVRTDGGGRLNGALLAAGLVDEIGMILNPSVSADPEGRRFFELPHALRSGVRLRLEEHEVLGDGSLWLRYSLDRATGSRRSAH